jgi:hypothetical protein
MFLRIDDPEVQNFGKYGGFGPLNAMYLPASKLTSTQLRPDEAMIVLSEGYRTDPVRAKSRSAFSMAHMSWRLLVKMGDSRCMFL